MKANKKFLDIKEELKNQKKSEIIFFDVRVTEIHLFIGINLESETSNNKY